MGELIPFRKRKLRDGGTICVQSETLHSFSSGPATLSTSADDDVWDCIDCPIRDIAVFTDEAQKLLKKLGRAA